MGPVITFVYLEYLNSCLEVVVNEGLYNLEDSFYHYLLNLLVENIVACLILTLINYVCNTYHLRLMLSNLGSQKACLMEQLHVKHKSKVKKRNLHSLSPPLNYLYPSIKHP